MSPTPVILDTNIFVAAGFKPNSASGGILQQIQNGNLQMLWNEQTHREIEEIIRKIPPLDWQATAHLFAVENCFQGPIHPEAFEYVPDPADRKFAALAAATGAILITLDTDLLDSRGQAAVTILRPREFLSRAEAETD
jgi:uncharacterized protein